MYQGGDQRVFLSYEKMKFSQLKSRKKYTLRLTGIIILSCTTEGSTKFDHFLFFKLIESNITF